MDESFCRAPYLSLATFRRNGAEVATPVWFAARGGDLYVFSAGDAGKVKRLRNSTRARIALCNMRGGILGPWRDAQAFIVTDAAEQRAAHAALLDKYGWQMRLLDVFSSLGGRIGKRTFIRIET